LDDAVNQVSQIQFSLIEVAHITVDINIIKYICYIALNDAWILLMLQLHNILCPN
jgi:hypothetical protein